MTGRLFDVQAERSLSVTVLVHDRGDCFEAELADYPLRESGRSAWEAVNRLIGAHRELLERRWPV
jgi:hypothetical protein